MVMCACHSEVISLDKIDKVKWVLCIPHLPFQEIPELVLLLRVIWEGEY